MYRHTYPTESLLKGVEKFEGELIEQKVARITEAGDPIKDGAPLIYTDRKDGVLPAYDIRTDRFEVAADAMNKIHADEAAKTDGGPGKVVDLNKPKEGGNKSVGEA